MFSTDWEAKERPSLSSCTWCQGCGFQWTGVRQWTFRKIGFSCFHWWMNSAGLTAWRQVAAVGRQVGPTLVAIVASSVAVRGGEMKCGQQCSWSLKCEDVPSVMWSPWALAAGQCAAPAVWWLPWISGNCVVYRVCLEQCPGDWICAWRSVGQRPSETNFRGVF